MSKIYHRFFAGAMKSQTRWLNKMAKRGYRLIKTGKTSYEFEICEPDSYEYYVEYIGDKSKENAEKYKCFLEDMGYVVFYKNINLNYSSGKVVYNPLAEKGGRIISNETTMGKELLIVERTKDMTPFELHTTKEDQKSYLIRLSKCWLCVFAMFLILFIITRNVFLGIISCILLIPLLIFCIKILTLNHEMQIRE